MKLSPATIFFLLLIFLVLSALFCRWAVQDVDGFIGYRKNAEQLTEVILPMYSDKNKLTKLYDNVYFDNKSGSIVEIESPQANKPAVVTFDEKTQKTVTTTPPERVDDTGSTITALHVLPRTGNVAKSYKIEKSTDVIPAPATTTDNSYTSKVYQTNTGGVKQSVIMMPWKDTTYVHIMNNYTSPKDRNVGTFFFTPGAPALSFSYKGVQTIEITGERADTNPNNNTLVIEPLYNTKRKVYQISEYVKYDISNANLLITVDAKELIIYTRDGGAFQVLETAESTNGDEQPTVKNSAFMPRVLHDELGQNMVIYVPNGKQTLVALVCANDKQLDLRNVCRFNETGIENGKPSTASSGIGAKTASSGVEAKTASSIGAKTDSSSIGAKMTTTADIDMDNYMLKTQIIPPVCPSCPSCNFNFSGVCNQCGGNGGCGAQTINGESLLIGGNPIRDAKDSSGNILGILADTSANIIRRPGDSSGNIIRRPGDSSGNIISRPADTAAGKPADTSGNIVDKPGNAAGKQGGAAGKHGGAAGKQGGAAGKHGGAAGKQGGAAGNAAGKPGNATGRRDKFGNVINNTIDTAGNVVNRTIDTAGNVVNTTVGTVGNVATNALGVVGNILGGAGNKNQSGAGSQRGYAGAMPSQRGQYGPASAMPSQRSQYGAAGAMPSQRGQYGPASAMPSQRGQYGPASAMPSQRGQPASAGGSTNMADPYSYQGALPAKKPTDFMPLTADFSNFGR